MRFAKLKALYAKPEMKASLLTFSIFVGIFLFVVFAYNFPIATIVVLACIAISLMVSLIWLVIYEAIKQKM